MPMPRGRRFYVCPDCGRRGAYLRWDGVAGDVWVCRYESRGCDWTGPYNYGHDDIDVKERRRIRFANPDRAEQIWVSDFEDPDD